MNEIIQSAIVLIKTNGVTLAKVLVLMLGGSLGVNLLVNILKRIIHCIPGIDEGAGEFVLGLLRLALYLALFIEAIQILGLDTAALLSQLGVMLAALALVLKDDVASLANGMMLVATKPFVAGDFVTIGGTSGKVRAIHLFSTELSAPNGDIIRIPNAQMLNGVITNCTKIPVVRVQITVGVAYGTDLKKASKTIKQALAETAIVMKSPAPQVILDEMDSSSINYKIWYWCQRSDRWGGQTAVFENIYDALTKNNIEIPFNQLDVHVKDLPLVQLGRDSLPTEGEETGGDK